MRPRYFLKYEDLREATPTIKTVMVGRFSDVDRATEAAKEQYAINGSTKLISIRPETETEALQYPIIDFL